LVINHKFDDLCLLLTTSESRSPRMSAF